jgi:hypothetical protein
MSSVLIFYQNFYELTQKISEEFFIMILQNIYFLNYSMFTLKYFLDERSFRKLF